MDGSGTREQTEAMMKLSQASLTDLPAGVAVPDYDRNLVRPGILHVGLGNFHRAHQAVYLDAALNAGGDLAWGIRGAGVRAPDARMREMLAGQDWLYTVTEVEHDSYATSVIGAMNDFIDVQPAGNAPLIAAMTDPDTRIVSLTVTEGGYFLDAATGRFDLSHPAVAADIANPGTPGTVFGAIIAALAARKAEGDAPFTVMSCDNLPGNGDVARMAVIDLARAMNRNLASWIEDNVTFPNGMVDRITPATGDRERALLTARTGIIDAYPVFCEPFKQWVLEDKFVSGRPELERVGVTFTDRIHDFERMKIRILNGGHAIMAYPSGLLGIPYAHDAVADPLIAAYLRKVLTDEVLHLVPDVPGFTPAQYLELIFSRLENPGVADTIARLCFDGSNRQPKFIVPSIVDNLHKGLVPRGLALHSALWCRYCMGVDDQGKEIPENDPNWKALQTAARKAQSDPVVWLQQETIYGALAQDKAFVAEFASALQSLAQKGTEKTLRGYLGQ